MKRLSVLVGSAASIPLLLAGCGGSGSDGGSTVPVVVAPTPTPTPTPTGTPTATPTPTPSPSASPTPTPTPAPTSAAALIASLYDVAPDVSACRAGTLKASVKADMLQRINAARALHRLAPVTYSDVEDQAEQESSLMMVANNQLSHTPPSTWTCYTALGAAGAGSSNLASDSSSTWRSYFTEDDYLAGWLRENASASIGHRRWILDPFLGKTSYGRVTQVDANGRLSESASLRVFSFAGGTAVPAGVPPFVAYPYGDYPIKYFAAGDILSFSVVVNGAGRGGNGSVDFSRASVTVTGPSGALAVSEQASDNIGYGIANSIQWKVAGLQAGVTYTVTIAGVANAPQSSYTYSFRMVS